MILKARDPEGSTRHTGVWTRRIRDNSRFFHHALGVSREAVSTHASKTSGYQISIESLDEDGPREMSATKIPFSFCMYKKALYMYIILFRYFLPILASSWIIQFKLAEKKNLRTERELSYKSRDELLSYDSSLEHFWSWYSLACFYLYLSAPRTVGRSEPWSRTALNCSQGRI